MKKLAAILISGLLLFNWGGYHFLFSYMENRANRLLNNQLDNDNYQTASLVTIKLPVTNLPYYTNSPIFERVHGEVSVNGLKYQFVERRIFNDSLEMRCIPNTRSMHLTNARDEFFKLVNDLQQAGNEGSQHPAKSSVHLKNILSEYLENALPQAFSPHFQERIDAFSSYADRLSTCFHSPAERPPDQDLIFSV